MTLCSMTGFSRRDGTTRGQRWTWELRSVNGKGLDARLRLPPGLDRLEIAVRERVGKRLTRGNLQISLTLARETAATTLRVNDEVLAAVVAARAGEGAAIGRVLGGHVEAIERLTAAAEACPARRPEAIRARLAEQVTALLDAVPALDPQRLAQEAVLIATRADIREELDRLTAHVAEARRLLAGGGPVGRKLDFLAQEFNRETNTLCSKANVRELTAIGLDLKAVVDQLREQIQNIE